PESGRSSPAIERSVVVLPQPEGPSSVKNFPFSTSKAMSRAARNVAPRPVRYSVLSARTLSMSDIPNAEAAPEGLGEEHKHEQRCHHHDAERGELHILAVLPQLPQNH